MTQYGDEPREPTSAVVRDGLVMNALDAKAIDEIRCLYGHHDLDEQTKVCGRCGALVDMDPIVLDFNELPQGMTAKYDDAPLLPGGWPDYKHMWFSATENDPEPDTYAIVNITGGWWGLMNMRSGTIVVKAHGAGAYEEIADRWNAKTAGWLAWRERQDG